MYELLPHQDDFLYSDAIHTGLVGGFRCGKTFIAVLKTVAKKMQYPGINVAYYLPNYPLIRDIAYPYFEEVLTKQNIPFQLNRQEKKFITSMGDIFLRSMHQPEFIVGYEVGYSLVDEADILTKDKMDIAYKKILSRNSIKLPDGKSNSTDFVSTPEGFKFLYEFFEINKNSSKKLIRGRTMDNPHISESYVQTLLDEYTEEELKAYLDGEFVNLTSGTVYRNFERLEHDSIRLPTLMDVLHIGMDFNIMNMSAVFYVKNYESPIVTAVDEIVKVYDTNEMIQEIKRRYPEQRKIIYPDASGNNRSTSGFSDIQLLKQAGFAVVAGKSNPSVRSRITKANKGFETNNHFVNVERCPNYAEGLEKLAYKNGQPDKSSGYDHVTDAGTYAYYVIGSNRVGGNYGKPKEMKTRRMAKRNRYAGRHRDIGRI